MVAKGEVGATGKIGATVDRSTESVKERRGLQQVVDEIGDSDFVLLLDDFHYMAREVQTEVAKSLKEAVRLGIKIVTASVTHRGDDVLRANPELRGRVRAIDLEYWTKNELQEIAGSGFSALNASIDPTAIDSFIEESAGSPQLMQLLCLQACFVLDLRMRRESLFPIHVNVDQGTLRRILEQTSASTDFRSLVDVLDAGPRTLDIWRRLD